MNSGSGCSRTRQQSGFTYLAALLLIAVTGAGVAAIAEAWSHTRQREKEAELMWIGNQFVQAIGLYYQRSPGTVKRYPETLDDLLEDKRFLTVQRYLRRLYPDPLTGKADWALVVAPSGGIMGVRSLSTAAGLRTPPQDGGAAYDTWKFVYSPPQAMHAPTPPSKP